MIPKSFLGTRVQQADLLGAIDDIHLTSYSLSLYHKSLDVFGEASTSTIHQGDDVYASKPGADNGAVETTELDPSNSTSLSRVLSTVTVTTTTHNSDQSTQCIAEAATIRSCSGGVESKGDLLQCPSSIGTDGNRSFAKRGEGDELHD